MLTFPSSLNASDLTDADCTTIRVRTHTLLNPNKSKVIRLSFGKVRIYGDGSIYPTNDYCRLIAGRAVWERVHEYEATLAARKA